MIGFHRCFPCTCPQFRYSSWFFLNVVTRAKPTGIFLFTLYSPDVFRLMHQVLYNTSGSGGVWALYVDSSSWKLWKYQSLLSTAVQLTRLLGLIPDNSKLPMDSDLASLLSWPPESCWLHGRSYVGRMTPFIPNCVGVNGTSIQICCVTSASSSVVILYLFSFFLPHSFPSNWGALKAKPQNPIDFKFILSKRRLK